MRLVVKDAALAFLFQIWSVYRQIKDMIVSSNSIIERDTRRRDPALTAYLISQQIIGDSIWQ